MSPDSKKHLRGVVNCVSVVLSIIAMICIPFSSHNLMTWIVWLQFCNVMILMVVRSYTKPNK
jgi:hypothetical protein